MPPNTIELTVVPDPEISVKEAISIDQHPRPVQRSEENYKLKIFQYSIVQFAHILIGATTAVAIMFGFRNGLPLNATSMHVVLCVIGYQLLMAEAILSLSSENGWTSKLRPVDKRRAHWILQILGSGLAIGGSIYKILDKTEHWNTRHGQFALVAMVFTSISMINGLASLYAHELRKILPGNISKLSHICFGTVGFMAASVTLCLGFDKNGFKNWSNDAMANVFIAFVTIFTAIVIINPLITFYNKTANIVKK